MYSIPWLRRALLVFFLWSTTLSPRAEEPLLFAHYMPWFATKSISGAWGWHWTMDHFNPDEMNWEGERKAASHQTPLIGLYDSSDPDTLECHALLMKLAGFDGAIIDWYGTGPAYDYARNARNTETFIGYLKRAGLRFAICYEDQAIRETQKLHKQCDAFALGRQDFIWLDQHLFNEEGYLKLNDQPVLLVFGPQYFPADSWQRLRSGLAHPPRLFGLPHLAGDHGCDGAFGWPPVSGGKTVSAAEWRKELATLYARQATGDLVIATAFPGFNDIYRQAGLHDSYGHIDERGGATLTETLDLALTSGARIVQVATWNDFGEGTMVEPTRSQGFRKLETIQSRAPRLKIARSPFSSADLLLPVQLYRLRKQCAGNATALSFLEQASAALFLGRCAEAETMLAKAALEAAKMPALLVGSSDATAPAYRLAPDIFYRDEAEVSEAMKQRCRLDVYSPANATGFPTVIWLHGGGLQAGEKSIPLALRQRGIAVVTANYRRAPEAASPAYIEDAAAVVAWTFRNISNFGGSTNAIFVSGHSAGAYLACMVGLDRRWLAPYGILPTSIAGLIPLSPQAITHFTIRGEHGIGEKQPVIDDLAPLYHVRRDAPPMLIVTGDREKELNGRYEENAYFWRMLKLVGHPDVQLREMTGYDHGGMPEPAFPLLLEFVQQHVPKGAP